MKNSDELMEMIKGVYLQYTKVPKKELNNMLKHDLWFNAKTSIKYGIVDKIL